MIRILAFTLSAVALSVAFGTAHGQGEASIAGQKIDSGLGGLPHYSQWVDKTGRSPMGTRVIGESLDSGLGELPNYSKWADKTGRNPLRSDLQVVGTTRR
jgi:hypothetical protein